MYSILLVDDERCVLDSLVFSLKKEQHNILTAESGMEALEVLKEEDVSLIISDVLMPGINGIELIKMANEVSPLSVKMLLSGFSEVEMIIEAINSGILWRYLLKPWDNEDLIVTINTALQYYQLNLDKLKLMDELKYKNHELEDLNLCLENKVQERTQLLTCYNDLLVQLLDGIPVETFLHNVVNFLSDTLHTQHISLIIPGETSYNTYSSVEIQNSSALNKLITKVKDNKEKCHENDICAIPILNNNTIYAIVVIKSCNFNCSKNQSIFDTLSSILKIALQRYRLKDKTEHLINDIDRLLEECH